jgi:hypothetical protein
MKMGRWWDMLPCPNCGKKVLTPRSQNIREHKCLDGKWWRRSGTYDGFSYTRPIGPWETIKDGEWQRNSPYEAFREIRQTLKEKGVME